MKEQIRLTEIERDKFKEMYLEVSKSTLQMQGQTPTLVGHPDLDAGELKQQIRDLSEQVQDLELVRDDMAIRIQQQAVDKEELIDQLSQIKLVCDQQQTEYNQNLNNCKLYQEQVNLKNTIIDKLRTEFTELGDENTKLRADISKFVESKEKQEQLLDSANVNQDDLVKDYQALQYRCSETERREQEALLYIKDCLKLVEQTQHEKEQLIIQAAQSENMRQEIEDTLNSIVEEAGRRIHEEVEKIRRESNKKMAQLIQDSGVHQERVAELEAKIEEMEREQVLNQINGNSTDEIALADKDAIIFKLRDHIDKLQQDKTNLTDQLMEVTNTMRLSKEHFESKLLTLNNQLAAQKEKLSRVTQDNTILHEDKDRTNTESDAARSTERALKHKIQGLKSVLTNTEKRSQEDIAELRQDEENKRDVMRRAHDKLVNNLRAQVLDKQSELNKVQEVLSQTQYSASNKESELRANILNLSKKVKETSGQYKTTLSNLEKSRDQCCRESEERHKLEVRLRAVNMQLNSANSQIELVTENEAKLCSKQKELQIRIDELEFELQRNKTSHNNSFNYHSTLGNLIIKTPVVQHKTTTKSSTKKRDKRDKKEKHEISKVFSSQLRSKADKPTRDRRATSTPHTDKSDVTIKFTDHHTPDISGIDDDSENIRP